MRHDLTFKPGEPAVHVSAREGYDRWAPLYDAEPNPLVQLEESVLPGLLGDVAGLDVADLGCGTGRHASRLARAGARVVALDFSEQMLAEARAKTAGAAVRFVQHDLAALPLPLAAAAFDRVLCCLVLDHVESLRSLFEEMRRILRPDGRILCTTVHPAMLLRGIHAHFRDPATGVDVCPASVPYELSDYVLGATRAGLRIEHMSEHAIDAALAAQSSRAAKYLGWPMLLVMELSVPAACCA